MQNNRRILEVVTVEEQALEDVMASPRFFTVPLKGDFDAWRRASLFFNMYLNEASSIPFDADRIVSSRRKGAQYVYEVKRKNLKNGVKYQVFCYPVTISAEKASLADRNARNLARFIREGTLERMFLEQ